MLAYNLHISFDKITWFCSLWDSLIDSLLRSITIISVK